MKISSKKKDIIENSAYESIRKGLTKAEKILY